MHLLSIKDLNIKDINEIFRLADQLEENDEMLLKNKTFVLFFPESSIRTRYPLKKELKVLVDVAFYFRQKLWIKEKH